MEQHLYAGWFVLDLRLLLFVSLVSVLLTIGTIALFVRHRRWHEYVTVAAALLFLSHVSLIVLLNLIADYPVFLVESLFAFP